MSGPIPSGDEQAIIFVVTVVFFGLGALVLGSVGRRWLAALRQVPSAYRRGKERKETGDGE